MHGSILILIAAVVSSLVVSFGSFGNFTMTVISLEELSKHTAPNDTWMAIHGLVYDTSGFMTEHPGGQVLVCRCSDGCRWPHSGAQLLESVAGQDASAEFEACPRFASPPAQSVSARGCGWQDALHSTAARTEEKISCKGVLAGSEKQAVGSVSAETCAFSSPRPCTTKPLFSDVRTVFPEPNAPSRHLAFVLSMHHGGAEISRSRLGRVDGCPRSRGVRHTCHHLSKHCTMFSSPPQCRDKLGRL